MKKNILLIGGSYGIGNAIATKLSEQANVYIASRSTDNLPAGVTHLNFDVLKDNPSELDLPDTLHGFVYCPGSINLKPLRGLKPEHFREDLELNFIGLVKTVQAMLPRLKKAEASLVFFSTVAVKVGMPFHTSVAASKGAIEGFARAMAAEMAPTLRINVIAPSLTDTPLAAKLLSSEEKKEKMGERHPLKRVGTVQDIANMAVFLLSGESSWMTGQVLGVDGGISVINVN